MPRAGAVVRRPSALALLLALADPGAADSLWGVQAGVQRDAPSVRDDRDFGSQGSWAPAAGAFWGLRQGRWSARVEVAMARRRFASTAFVTETPLVADFLELGLVAARRAGSPGRRWAIGLEAGPQIGLRLRARRRFRDLDQDVANELREADLKARLGLRAERAWGAGRLFFGSRFAFGLTDLDATNQQQIRSRALALFVGYER